MSHLLLRRLMIRMLHDPRFVEAVYATPDTALAPLPLTAAERALLTAPPQSAWGADAERPARVLAGLREEFPATLSLAAERLETFFSSNAFHRTIMERGSLAAALAEHLAGASDPRVAVLARLEGAIAAVRRAPRTPLPSPTGFLRCTPHAVCVELPGGATALFERLRRGEPPEPLGPTPEHVLVLYDAATMGVSLAEVSDGIARVLATAETPSPRAVLHATACALGASPAEADALLHELVADDILL